MIPEETPVLRVDRDAWTRLLYLQLGAFAFFLYAFSPSIGFLKDDLHLSAGVAGLHSTLYAVGVTCGGATATWFIARTGGSGRAMWSGLAGMCSGVAAFCVVPALAVTLPSATVCGLFGSYVCIACPSALARAHGPVIGAAAITEANAVAAMVGLIAPLAVGGAVALGLGWRTAPLLLIPISLGLYFFLGRVREPRAVLPQPDVEVEMSLDPAMTESFVVGVGVGVGDRYGAGVDGTGDGSADGVGVAVGGWRTLPKRFWVNQIAGVCTGAIEFCLTLWSADLLVNRTGLDHGTAATGVTAIVAGMALGRAFGGTLALRFPMDRLLFGAFACNLAGFALFWLIPSPVPMFAGLALAGLGMSLEFPLVSARAINLSDGRPELAGAVNMLTIGLAIGTAPFALGVMSDQIGIHSAYLLVPALIAVAVAALAGSRTPRRETVRIRTSETIAA